VLDRDGRRIAAARSPFRAGLGRRRRGHPGGVATSVWLVRPAPQPAGSHQPRRAAACGGREGPDGQLRPGSISCFVILRSGCVARQVSVRLAARDVEEPLPESHLLPALAEIEPLRFASIEPEALQLAGLEVASLTAVPSIEIPSLGSGSNETQSADPKKENRP